MKLFFRILKYSAIGIIALTAMTIASLFIYSKFFYYHEFNSIKKNLERNEKVEIVEIWGNPDLTFENVYAVLKVKNKGNLSIYNLSSDENQFPEEVLIGEIENYTFVHFLCRNSMSWNLNVGTESDFGKKTGLKFNNVDDVIDHYDEILKYVETFKSFPQYNYLQSSENTETILFVDSCETMNSANLKKYYNSECIADLLDEINKTWNSKICEYPR